MELDLTGALVAGIPLMLVVIGIVQYVKTKLEWSGKGVEVFAILWGLVVGFLYQMFVNWPVVWDFPFVFMAVFFGLAVGLVATGVYKAYHKEEK